MSKYSRLTLDCSLWHNVPDWEITRQLELAAELGVTNFLAAVQAPIRVDRFRDNSSLKCIQAFLQERPYYPARLVVYLQSKTIEELQVELDKVRSVEGISPEIFLFRDDFLSELSEQELRKCLDMLAGSSWGLLWKDFSLLPAITKLIEAVPPKLVVLPVNPLVQRDSLWQRAFDCLLNFDIPRWGIEPWLGPSWIEQLQGDRRGALSLSLSMCHSVCLSYLEKDWWADVVDPEWLGKPPLSSEDIRSSLPDAILGETCGNYCKQAPNVPTQEWVKIARMAESLPQKFDVSQRVSFQLSRLFDGGPLPLCDQCQCNEPPMDSMKKAAETLRAFASPLLKNQKTFYPPLPFTPSKGTFSPMLQKSEAPHNRWLEAIEKKGGWKEILGTPGPVTIKPNLVYPSPPPTTSNPMVLEALLASLVDEGFGPITVTDLAALRQLFGMRISGHLLGLPDICKRYGAEWFPIEDPWDVVVVPSVGDKITDMEILRPFYNEGYLLNLPVLKGHLMAGWSGPSKNMVGAVGLRTRYQLHQHYSSENKAPFLEAVAEIAFAVPAHFHIVDVTITSLDDHLCGTPLSLNQILLGTDLRSVEKKATELIAQYLPNFEATEAVPLLKHLEKLTKGSPNKAPKSFPYQ